MGREKLSLLSHLMKRAVRQMKLVVLSLKWRRYWRLIAHNIKPSGGASPWYGIRRWSFNDRLGLYGCLDDVGKRLDDSFVVKRFQKSTSFGHQVDDEDDDNDVDRRAEIFISNFRSQLRLERQVSLKLRYFQEDENSYNIEK